MSKGREGVRGIEATKWPQPYGASSIHQEPRKIIVVFHQEILLLKKVRNWSSPKGREGARGIEATSWPQPYGAKRR